MPASSSSLPWWLVLLAWTFQLLPLAVGAFGAAATLRAYRRREPTARRRWIARLSILTAVCISLVLYLSVFPVLVDAVASRAPLLWPYTGSETPMDTLVGTLPWSLGMALLASLSILVVMGLLFRGPGKSGEDSRPREA